MYPHPLALIDGLWILFLVVWLLAAIQTKREARRVAGLSRVVQMVLVVAGSILMFDPDVSLGFLGFRFLPDVAALAYLGVALTAGGIAFAIWARVALGQNWSSQVTLKQGHELIRRGPYALVRHPIYSGLLLALAGSALAIGRGGCILGWSLVAATYAVKIRQEEQLMKQTFPDAYPQYAERVKAFIPGIL